MQGKIFDSQDERSKKGGPENRMNDLKYKDWMKFQKSFYWEDTNDEIFVKSISFFTKEIWPDGTPSSSLIIGLKQLSHKSLNDQRIIHFDEDIQNIKSICERFESLKHEGLIFDFILIDLRSILVSFENLNDFITHSNKFFFGIKELLVKDRYAQIIVNHKESTGSGYPIAWTVGQASRRYLRLRDEKIGLIKSNTSINYSLFFQNSNDIDCKALISPDNLEYKLVDLSIPNYIFPKSPPRKKNEILHPAKFPETLITDFIELFTKPEDVVFDPMAGTGSTIVAANRIGRNGYGVDLISEFVTIAENRIKNEQKPSLFEEFKQDVVGKVFQGDSTDIASINQLSDLCFDYVVTSPPYWSMLNNPGSENQKVRKKKGLSLVYSSNERDLGNIEDYETFLSLLNKVYTSISVKLKTGGKLTIIVKNVKRNHILYTLAWDIVQMLCKKDGNFSYIGNSFWCQDDIGLKPFAVGTHWVSNILHHYCLHFEKR